MKTITAQDWNGQEAWLWEETGEGSLRRVQQIRSDWWIVTGAPGSCFTSSWCCHPGTLLYVGTPDEIDAMQEELRSNLRARHLRWDRDRLARARFDERDCGGVFDGNQVISDADPGL